MRALYLVLWLLLLAEAFLLSPPQRPDQDAWLMDLVFLRWEDIDPWVVVHFNLMGVWPLLLLAQLAPRLRRRPVPLWPFALSSFGVGAFGLLPGLALGGEVLEPRRWQGWIGHPAVGVLGGVGALTLVGWGLVAGDPAAWWRAFQSEQFVHVMGFDFLAVWLTSVLVAHEEGEGWWWTLVPLLGTAARVVGRRGDA